MTHAVRFVASVNVLTALALCVPVQAQTPEIEALRARAEEGDASVQFNLGFRYGNGRSVPQDDAEAVRWYRLAADQGHVSAQYNLGVMYANGEGVPQDDVEAHMWTNLAAAQSSGELRDHWVKNRDIIAAKMTTEQVAEAQRRAREWKPAPVP